MLKTGAVNSVYINAAAPPLHRLTGNAAGRFLSEYIMQKTSARVAEEEAADCVCLNVGWSVF